METMTSLVVPADIEVIESFVQGKYADQWLCEDLFVQTNDYIAVIDGATSTTNKSLYGKKAGRYAAEIIAQQVNRLPPRLTLIEAAALISQALSNELGQAKSDNRKLDGPSASILMFNIYRREIWRIGSGTFLVNGEIHMLDFPLDRILSSMRSAYITSCLQTGGSIDEFRRHDYGRQVILPMLKRQYTFRNMNNESNFAFGALDGNEIPEKFLEVHSLGAGTFEIVLASDGYPRAYPTLQQSEEYLSYIKETDPLCVSSFLTTKGFYEGQESFDDRAYVRFRIS